jgi:hypothetical protein
VTASSHPLSHPRLTASRFSFTDSVPSKISYTNPLQHNYNKLPLQNSCFDNRNFDSAKAVFNLGHAICAKVILLKSRVFKTSGSLLFSLLCTLVAIAQEMFTYLLLWFVEHSLGIFLRETHPTKLVLNI